MTPAQPSLPFAATIQERFEEFDARNPEVYAYLVSQCRSLRAAGWRHFGIRCLWERMRWHFQVERQMGEEYKLNDQFTSRYVRKLVKEHPEFEGLFELREIRAA
jgi:hypothetical protein